MFTGLVEGIGELSQISLLDGGLTRWVVDPTGVVDFSVSVGDSVALNGCCLTVVNIERGGAVSFDLSAETLDRTSFRHAKRGSKFNLERAMRLSDRLGGHMVTGHIDDLGLVEFLRLREDGCWDLQIGFSAKHADLVHPKGSICVNGVSLTVNHIRDISTGDAGRTLVDLVIIPHTLSATTIGGLVAGQGVNLEFDMIAKLLRRRMELN